MHLEIINLLLKFNSWDKLTIYYHIKPVNFMQWFAEAIQTCKKLSIII